MDERIFHLRKQILNNFRHDWTIKEMAEIVHLSASHLQKLFKSQMGISPIAYLHELRLEKACELLETTFDRISQIGFEIGMTNDSHFTRYFKKKYGSTPTEYRKRHSEKIQAEELDGKMMIESAEK